MVVRRALRLLSQFLSRRENRVMRRSSPRSVALASTTESKRMAGSTYFISRPAGDDLLQGIVLLAKAAVKPVFAFFAKGGNLLDDQLERYRLRGRIQGRGYG